MALLRPTPWTSQPQHACEIDPDFNPIYAWNGSQPLREIAKGLPVTGFNDGAGSTFEIGNAGRNAFLWTTGTQSRIRIAGAVSPGNEFIAVVNYQNSIDNTSAIFMACKNNWNQPNGFMFESKTNTDTLEINGGDGSTFPTISVPNVGKADGKIHTLVVRYRGTKASVAFDGRYIGEVTIAAAGTWPDGLSVGNYAGTAYSATPGRKIYCAAVLGKGDIVSLSANPWQIFKPLPRRIFAPVATSSDHLIIGANSSQANTASQGAISQSHLATISNSTQANTSAQAAINQTHLVSVASSNQSNVASDAAISQSAITLVTVANSNQANTTSDAGIQQTHLATAANSAQTNTTSDAATQQTHLVAVSNSNQANTASQASITQTLDKYVAAADNTQTNTASAGSIQQTHLIQCAGVAIDNVASASAVVQEHLLTAANSVQGNVASAGSAITILPTIARPTSDVSNTGWSPATGSDLFAMLDEVSPDDADYISTASLGATCKLSLNSTQYPGSAAQQLSLRASSSTGNGISVTIKDGATTIATRSLILTPTYDLHTITLTSGEIAAITSGNLTVEMTSI